MKVSRKSVIADNISLVAGFVPGLLATDPPNIQEARVGDRVTVSPDDTPTEMVTVIFKVRGGLCQSQTAQTLRN